MICDRRTLLRNVGGLGLLAATGGCSLITGTSTTTTSTSAASTATSSASASASASSCAAATGLSAGPYHLDYNEIREDIAEDREGVPLDLYIAIVRSGACSAIQNAAVEVWHCDADGLYSGFSSVSPAENTESSGATSAEQTDDGTFLRGIALTDKTGTAHFTSIYPGWVANRAPHIYVRVITGGTKSDTKYSGGTVIHTGQIFFPDATTKKVAATSPYSSIGTKRIALTSDADYKKAGKGAALELTAAEGTEEVSDGYIGVAVLRVNT